MLGANRRAAFDPKTVFSFIAVQSTWDATKFIPEEQAASTIARIIKKGLFRSSIDLFVVLKKAKHPATITDVGAQTVTAFPDDLNRVYFGTATPGHKAL